MEYPLPALWLPIASPHCLRLCAKFVHTPHTKISGAFEIEKALHCQIYSDSRSKPTIDLCFAEVSVRNLSLSVVIDVSQAFVVAVTDVSHRMS